MEEELLREVHAPRKPAKISFWEADEEKIVDVMKPGAQISIQRCRAVGGTRAAAACKPTEQKK